MNKNEIEDSQPPIETENLDFAKFTTADLLAALKRNGTFDQLRKRLFLEFQANVRL